MAIGISFLPSDENQAQGPQRRNIEGGGGDLEQAFKVLSLRLPQVLGAKALSSRRLLTSPGSSGMAGSPDAAVFQALIKAMLGGDQGYVPDPGRAGPYPTQPEPRMGIPGGREDRNPFPRISSDPGTVYFDNPAPAPRPAPPTTRLVPGMDAPGGISNPPTSFGPSPTRRVPYKSDDYFGNGYLESLG